MRILGSAHLRELDSRLPGWLPTGDATPSRRQLRDSPASGPMLGYRANDQQGQPHFIFDVSDPPVPQKRLPTRFQYVQQRAPHCLSVRAGTRPHCPHGIQKLAANRKSQRRSNCRRNFNKRRRWCARVTFRWAKPAHSSGRCETASLPRARRALLYSFTVTSSSPESSFTFAVPRFSPFRSHRMTPEQPALFSRTLTAVVSHERPDPDGFPASIFLRCPHQHVPILRAPVRTLITV